jgi:hypothetical protein
MHKEKTYFFVTLPFVFLVYAFLLLIVAPGRGAGWMLDDGLFLINAWNVVHGFGLDGMLPQQPNYLINALFMKMGITEILHQRYIYYALWSLSAWTFFSGLTLSRRDSLQIIAIVATLCISYSSVLVGAVFFPLAIGYYFYGSVAKGFHRSALFILSGFFFAIVAFMHIAFVIAICMILAFIYWIDRSARNSMLMPIFLATSILLWTIYLNQLGLDRFFTAPAGHETNLLHLMKNAWSVIWFFLSAILAFNFFAFLFRA